MYLIELLLALQSNDFSVSQSAEVRKAVTKVYERQQATAYFEQCSNFVERFIHNKEQLGGIYANFQ